MTGIVTVLGGYGVFGSRISAGLAGHLGCAVRIVGRDGRAAAALARRIGAEARVCDLGDIGSIRKAVVGSNIVIHAAGPFQRCDYRVAEVAIEAGAHYLDIADARGFVTGIKALDGAARARGLFVSSGASSVPAITHAMVAALSGQFQRIDHIQCALSPGNQNPRGASTIAAILSYLGRPLRVWQDGEWMARPGWGDALWLLFPPPVGRRRVQACDAPDLDLFPDAWNARTVRFHAGLELGVFNRVLSFLAWLRRFVPLRDLPRWAPLFRRVSLLLFRFGSRRGSLGVWLRGIGQDGAPAERSIAIVTDDDGPATPCAPAVVLAKRILDSGPPAIGAFPCTGFLTLDELMAHLRPAGIWCARDWEPWEPHPG